MNYLNRAYDGAAITFHGLRAADFCLQLGRIFCRRKDARLLLIIIGLVAFLRWVFFPDHQLTTPITWTLDPTCPYHVLASLPGKAFTPAQMKKLDIGWEAAPFPANIDNGGLRGRTIEAANFYPLSGKLDPHYGDLVARKWPDDRGVGVRLGLHAPIVEFVAAVSVYDPESGHRHHHDIHSDGGGGDGAMIEQVAVVPGAAGGDRLSLPRLLKEGWVVIGKEEVAESEAAARKRQRKEIRSKISSTASSGGYAWDGDREFEGFEAGGWKIGPLSKPSPYKSVNLYDGGVNTVGKEGTVPVLTLRHRATGTLLRSYQRGDAWLVETLVEDNRPPWSAWWKREGVPSVRDFFFYLFIVCGFLLVIYVVK